MSTQNGPQELERALATLAASNQAVIQATSEQQLMARLCRVVVEEGRYRMAWIGQACHDPEKRVMPIAQVGDTGAYLKSIQISWANEALGRGPTGDAILTGEPVACNNLQGKPAHHAWSATALQHGFRASIALPFGVGADRFTLNIYAGEPDAFGPHELALLRGVAENLAFGLDHLRHRARQRETEAALRLTAARLTEAQRIACLGYWEWDLRTDALHWSDEIYIIFGLERDHVSAHVTNFDERVHPDDRDTVNRALEAALSGQSGYSLEHRIVRPDGEVRIMQEEGEVTFDPDGKAVRMAGTVQDITERRRVEDELARRTAQLEQARELEKLKNNFVSAVSHELRSPLTVIRGYTEFLEDEAQTPEWRAYLDQIQQATARLERLVDDLLDAARLDAGTFALHLDPTDLATKCKQALESMRRQAEQVGVQLALSVPTQPIMLRVDPQRIDQVLVNLLTNALKFTRPGGHVALNVLPLADAVRFEVRDDGIGIDDADLARLFKRFSQLEGGVRRGGTGLGLSISKAIVEAHGGCIGVESAPGRGSTFWFTLPRADSEG